MTHLQKVFALGSIMYLLTKVCLGIILYLITVRIEKRAKAFKRKRQIIQKNRRILNQEIYSKQYINYERTKGKPIRKRDEVSSLSRYGTREWLEHIR